MISLLCSLTTAAVAGIAALVSMLDGAQLPLAFFVAALGLASVQAWAVRFPTPGRNILAVGIAVVWLIAGVWIDVLLLMFHWASRPAPKVEATYLGVTATVYHLVALHLGAILLTASAMLAIRSGTRSVR
ncbi:MAG: hypothetical protein EXR69_10410 [Myxococcales bacterium]|nr:hypothetical protein [Myxococcales bacterium]